MIRLLKKLVEGRYARGAYRGSGAYRLQLPKAYGGRQAVQAYNQPKPMQSQEQSFKPKIERQSYSSGKVWTEPTPYRPEKERIVYDPEVKTLLKRIEDRLANLEPDTEQLLQAIRKHPELYDELSDVLMRRMLEDSERLEAAFLQEKQEESRAEDQSEDKAAVDYAEDTNELLETEPTESDMQEEKEEPENVEELQDAEQLPAEAIPEETMIEVEPMESAANEEVSEDDEFWRDLYLENEADVLREMRAEEELEANADKAVEEITSQDLSELEAELYTEIAEDDAEAEEGVESS
ncbi:MAG: hypothetical protein QW228_04920 [Candidatus Aenigmatarchaeota archaeon]